MDTLQAPVQTDRQLSVGVCIMLAAFAPAFVILAGLFVGGMSTTIAVMLALGGILLFIGGAIYANWRVAGLFFVFCGLAFAVLYPAIFVWMPRWLQAMGINF